MARAIDSSITPSSDDMLYWGLVNSNVGTTVSHYQ
jgi:hypothetical protein